MISRHRNARLHWLFCIPAPASFLCKLHSSASEGEGVGYVGAGYFKVGYKLFGSSFLKLETRLTTIGEADIRGMGYGQFDIAHRASTFLESEIVNTGKVSVRSWKEVNFQIIKGSQKFSITTNPWLRRVWHFGPNQ